MPPPSSAIDTAQFERIARRNVTLPLVAGVVSAGAFIAFFLYFLQVMGWVDHTHLVIGRFNELGALEADVEASSRAYLLTGDEANLAPYNLAKAQMDAQIDDLARLTADNPVQTDRLKRVRTLQHAYEDFAALARPFGSFPSNKSSLSFVFNCLDIYLYAF